MLQGRQGRIQLSIPYLFYSTLSFLITGALLFALVAFSSLSFAFEDSQITIVYTNDVQGEIAPCG